MKIVLHIERLVLEGLASGSAEAAPIEAAITGELARLLRTAPAVPASSARREAPAPPLGSGKGAAPSAIGNAIAHAVHGALRDPQ
jgi:hypothetical protein